MWTVPKLWPDQTAYIVAGGTSVAAQNVKLLTGRNTIAVNSSFEAVPFANFLFFGDVRWWQVNRTRIAKDFTGRMVTCSKAVDAPDIFKLKRICPNCNPRSGPLGPGLSEDPASVVSQRTSLQGAMNFAVHLGVKRIVLLGADMGRGPDGRSHHHSPHPWQNKPGNATWDIQMIQLRLTAAPLKARGIEVLNASPISRIDWWSKVKFEDTL